MKRLKQFWLIILLAVLLLSSLFYWFEWRPTQIRNKCSFEADVAYVRLQISPSNITTQAEADDFKNMVYLGCVQEKGLAN